MTMAALLQETSKCGGLLMSRGSVRYHCGGERGRMQEGMLLEK